MIGNMGTLGVFNLVTLDGYIAGAKGDISWHNSARERPWSRE